MADKNTPAFRGTVTAIPEGKGTPEEWEERNNFYSGDDNIYSPGINVGKPGFYDPEKGSQKLREPRPDVTPGPTLATDAGQPRVKTASVISRTPALDKSEKAVVSSGRKQTSPKA